MSNGPPEESDKTDESEETVEESAENTLEADIRTLRLAVDDALAAISAGQDVALPRIGDMVESLTAQLQQRILSMKPDERDAILEDLTHILTGFSALEEAIKATAPLGDEAERDPDPDSDPDAGTNN